jgi:hypothetical protein
VSLGAVAASSSEANDGSPVTWRIRCLCPKAPIQFFGPTCAFGLVSLVPSVSRFTGGQSVVLFGVGMERVVGLFVGARSIGIRFGAVQTVQDSLPGAADAFASLPTAVSRGALQAITFTTPALISNASSDDESSSVLLGGGAGGRRLLTTEDDAAEGALVNPPSSYHTLSLRVSLPGTVGLTTLNYSSLLFYSSSSCLEEGTFGPNGVGGCRPCPLGGVCPGGNRAWPLPGYWSFSPFAAPLRCQVPEACTGIPQPTVANTEQYYAARNTDDVDEPDSKCSAGYTGARCVSCSSNYYATNGFCFYCGSSTDQSQQMRLSIFGALVSMVILASSVALLDAIPLAYAVTGFVVLQDMAQVGKSAANRIPAGGNMMSKIFTYVNVVNCQRQTQLGGQVPTTHSKVH